MLKNNKTKYRDDAQTLTAKYWQAHFLNASNAGNFNKGREMRTKFLEIKRLYKKGKTKTVKLYDCLKMYDL